MSRPLLPLAATALLATACFPAKAPIETSFFDGAEDTRTLMVMLPGFGARHTAFEKKGIIDAAREAGLESDIIAVDLTYGYYISNSYDERLRESVFDVYRDQYDHIWVLGISMGGMGTLLTTQAFYEDIDGAILLSPFLGRRKTMRALQEVGIEAWEAPETDRLWDEELWAWMQDWEARDWNAPPLYLGHGDADLGMRNLKWMADQLPEGRHEITAGGHTWTVWAELTRTFVQDHLLQMAAFGGAEADAPEAAVAEADAPEGEDMDTDAAVDEAAGASPEAEAVDGAGDTMAPTDDAE